MTRTSSKSLLLTSAALAAILLAGCSQPKWRFIVTGDSRDGENGVNTLILSELAAQIVKAKADLVLITGDLVTGYNDQAALHSQLNTWIETMKPVYDAGIGVYAVRGNHDVGRPPGVDAWNNVFTGKFAMPVNGPPRQNNLTYSFTHKNALIVGLDQYIELRRVDQDWLDSQLAANTKPHIFLLGHEPAFKVKHEDCLDDYPARRDRFWASIQRAGARAYFCGHDHMYDHARVDGDGDPENDVHQYVVGTAGAPLYDWAGQYDGVNTTYTVENIYHAEEFGYCLVEIDGLDVTITWFERTAPGLYQPKEAWSYTVATPSQLLTR